MIKLNNITFSYEEDVNLFENLTLTLPKGTISLVGPNGLGKTTLMLLMAGRLEPQKGSISLFNTELNTIEFEEDLNKLATLVYQNLEIESEESIKNLIEFISTEQKSQNFVEEIIQFLHLESELSKKFHELSKGAMQKVLLAFALLYDAKIIFLDEPVFSLEDVEKHKTMQFIKNFIVKNNKNLVFIAHELDLCLQYSEHCILLSKDSSINLGKTQELLTPESLEKAYGFPYAMLKSKEYLTRESLEALSKH